MQHARLPKNVMKFQHWYLQRTKVEGGHHWTILPSLEMKIQMNQDSLLLHLLPRLLYCHNVVRRKIKTQRARILRCTCPKAPIKESEALQTARGRLPRLAPFFAVQAEAGSSFSIHGPFFSEPTIPPPESSRFGGRLKTWRPMFKMCKGFRASTVQLQLLSSSVSSTAHLAAGAHCAHSRLRVFKAPSETQEVLQHRPRRCLRTSTCCQANQTCQGVQAKGAISK